MSAIVFLVTYEGQVESPYEWQVGSYSQALELIEELQELYPDRKWSIFEKDVS